MLLVSIPLTKCTQHSKVILNYHGIDALLKNKHNAWVVCDFYVGTVMLTIWNHSEGSHVKCFISGEFWVTLICQHHLHAFIIEIYYPKSWYLIQPTSLIGEKKPIIDWKKNHPTQTKCVKCANFYLLFLKSRHFYPFSGLYLN